MLHDAIAEGQYEGTDPYDPGPPPIAPSDLQGIAPTGRPTQPYDAEHYVYLHSLYSTEYTDILIERINISHLSPKAKRAFVLTVTNFFAPTAFLSYQKDVEIAEIDLDIALNQLTLSCTKVDINLPEYNHIIELIRAHYNRFIISRTTGPERERILQNRTTFEQVSKIANDEEKKRSRRGLGVIGRFLNGGDN